jgi:EAL domain-containing protein (putative c-di-GMP-specific phosphodiesterase class I)
MQWWQAQSQAVVSARAATQLVDARLQAVAEELLYLRDEGAELSDAGTACPAVLRQTLVGASLDSLLAQRIVVVSEEAGQACGPQGMEPASREPWALLVDGRALRPAIGPSALEVAVAPDRSPYLVAHLDPRALDPVAVTEAWAEDLRAGRSGVTDQMGRRVLGEVPPAAVARPAAAWHAQRGLSGWAVVDGDALQAAIARAAPGWALAGLALGGLLVAGSWRQQLRRSRLFHRLQYALRRRQFEPVVQPIVDLSTGRCAGAEVLMRWHHPQRGVLGPAEFIEEAERTELIVPMSDLVMTRAAHRLSAIAQAHPQLYFSFNVTPSQLRSAGFGRRLCEIFHARSLPRERVLLEVTEREFVDGAAGRALAALRQDGWRIAIDDFGTGQSSLAALERLGADSLKIDRAFVRTIDEQTVRRPVLDAIITLAGQVGIKLIAEGVENRTQWDYLARRGVGFAQGFLFARPMRIEAFAAWLDAQSPDSAVPEGAARARDAMPAAAATRHVDGTSAALARRLSMPGGLDIRDRVYRLRVYPQCFVGRDAVDWLVREQGLAREQAVAVGRRLLALGLIRHVVDEHDFEDGELFYGLVTESADHTADLPLPRMREILREIATRCQRDHLRGWVRHRACVTGRELVEGLATQYGLSRTASRQCLAQLMRDGALRHVFDDEPLRDDRTLYRVA